MLNMIRADIYRLVHTRSFWVTELLVTILTVLTVNGGQALTFIVNGEEVSQTEHLAMTGINALQLVNSSTMFYYLLPLIILVLGSEYSKGTLKNIVTTGTSRNTFFFGKFLSYSVVVLLQYIWLLAWAFVMGTIKGGTGELTSVVVQNQLYYLFSGVLFVLAMSVFTNFVLYLTKNTAVSVLIAVILPLVIFAVHTFQPDQTLFEYIDMQGAYQALFGTTLKTAGDIQTSFIGAALIFIVGLGGTNWLFSKQDL